MRVTINKCIINRAKTQSKGTWALISNCSLNLALGWMGSLLTSFCCRKWYKRRKRVMIKVIKRRRKAKKSTYFLRFSSTLSVSGKTRRAFKSYSTSISKTRMASLGWGLQQAISICSNNFKRCSVDTQKAECVICWFQALKLTVFTRLGVWRSSYQVYTEWTP